VLAGSGLVCCGSCGRTCCGEGGEFYASLWHVFRLFHIVAVAHHFLEEDPVSEKTLSLSADCDGRAFDCSEVNLCADV